MTAKPILYCDDGSEIELPTKWVICSACSGEGKSSAYLGAYTRDDLDDAGPEFCAAYFAGHLDRPCISCDGLGRHRVADGARMTPAQRAAYRFQQQCEREDRAIERAERAAGC